jgi:hypothetical protein
MAFIPYRPAQPYVLTNVATGQVINATALNGVANSMRHLAERGRLPVTVTGARTNGKVIPAVGLAYPDAGIFRPSRKYISVPVEVPPHDTHFAMLFTYRCQVTYVGAYNEITGLDVDIDLMQAGAAYNIARGSFTEFLSPNPVSPYGVPYYSFQLVIGKLPNNLAVSLTEPTQLYLRVYADFTATYRGTVTGQGLTKIESRDSILAGTTVTPTPNLSTYWNGLMSLSFSTYRECESC